MAFAAESSDVGLMRVKTTMEKHDGRVLVDSQLEQGCYFSIKFSDFSEGENTKVS